MLMHARAHSAKAVTQNFVFNSPHVEAICPQHVSRPGPSSGSRLALLWPTQARRACPHIFSARVWSPENACRRPLIATALHGRLAYNRTRGYGRRSRRLAAQPGRAPNARSPRTIASSATFLTSVTGPLSPSCRHGQRNVNASSTRPPLLCAVCLGANVRRPFPPRLHGVRWCR